jgi:hypothetical protein
MLNQVLLIAPPYMTYITAHPRALTHLNAVSTPLLLTPQFSHAWDLPSLLIKPVQRLLKYGLLLGAVFQSVFSLRLVPRESH